MLLQDLKDWGLDEGGKAYVGNKLLNLHVLDTKEYIETQ